MNALMYALVFACAPLIAASVLLAPQSRHDETMLLQVAVNSKLAVPPTVGESSCRILCNDEEYAAWVKALQEESTNFKAPTMMRILEAVGSNWTSEVDQEFKLKEASDVPAVAIMSEARLNAARVFAMSDGRSEKKQAYGMILAMISRFQILNARYLASPQFWISLPKLANGEVDLRIWTAEWTRMGFISKGWLGEFPPDEFLNLPGNTAITSEQEDLMGGLADRDRSAGISENEAYDFVHGIAHLVHFMTSNGMLPSTSYIQLKYMERWLGSRRASGQVVPPMAKYDDKIKALLEESRSFKAPAMMWILEAVGSNWTSEVLSDGLLQEPSDVRSLAIMSEVSLNAASVYAMADGRAEKKRAYGMILAMLSRFQLLNSKYLAFPKFWDSLEKTANGEVGLQTWTDEWSHMGFNSKGFLGEYPPDQFLTLPGNTSITSEQETTMGRLADRDRSVGISEQEAYDFIHGIEHLVYFLTSNDGMLPSTSLIQLKYMERWYASCEVCAQDHGPSSLRRKLHRIFDMPLERSEFQRDPPVVH